ncbi:MAG: tetratricopeptide repeat protein [Desulfobacteraceae bacterium]
MKRLLAFILIILFLVLGMSFAGAQTAKELDNIGLEHFGKAYYEHTPKREHGRAASEYRQAERAFQEAIRSQPDWVDPYLHLGRTYFVQKKYFLAAEVYQKALAMAPQRHEIYLQLASALEMAGDYRGAVAVLKELRTREVDPRTLRILDDFIQRLAQRAAEQGQ